MSLKGETDIQSEEVRSLTTSRREETSLEKHLANSFPYLSLNDRFPKAASRKSIDSDEVILRERRESESDLFISCSDEDRLEEEEEEERLAESLADEHTVQSACNFKKVKAAWEKYWHDNSEDIVNKSWVRKYKDYINPEFDLSSWVGTDTAEEAKGNLQPQEEETTDVKPENSSIEVPASDTDALWLAEWESHYTQVYTEEYEKFLEKAKHDAEESIMPADIRRNPNLKKYWVQRYHLFSKYDDGIKLDEESWFSVTPESIAKHVAARCRRVDGVIVDAFCGCGGNTIQFAKKFDRVIAIDIDPVKVEYAKHNAKIYGVEGKIEFIVGDYMTLAPRLQADVVFLSPPWGGPEYLRSRIFDLKTMKPLSGCSIFEVTRRITPNIAFYVPRTTNKNQLMKLAGDGGFVEIEQNIFKSRTKAITAYYGDLIKPKFLKKRDRSGENSGQGSAHYG